MSDADLSSIEIYVIFEGKLFQIQIKSLIFSLK